MFGGYDNDLDNWLWFSCSLTIGFIMVSMNGIIGLALSMVCHAAAQGIQGIVVRQIDQRSDRCGSGSSSGPENDSHG